MMHESPCLSCTRVRDSKNCENKTCKDWQAWFIDRWESMREHVRAEMETASTTEVGIPLGGERYAHPHRVRAYLDTDPCDRCPCPIDVCHSPCPVKLEWSKKTREVNL